MHRLMMTLLLVCVAASAQTDAANAVFMRMATNVRVRPLKSLTTCGLALDDLSADAIQGGLNERVLQRTMSSQLTRLGIRISDGASLEGPFISATVSVTKLGSAGYSFSILLELRELTQPERDKGALFLSTTWRQFATGAADRTGLAAKVMDSLTLLLNDFKRDNALANEP